MFEKIDELTIGTAYEMLVRKCLESGSILKTDRPMEFGHESLALNMVTVVIREPFREPMKSDKSPSTRRYAEEYAMRYMILGDKVDGEAYTYGEQLNKNDQIDKCIQQIIDAPDRRDHVMSIAEPSLFGISDPPCLRQIGFRKYDKAKILMWGILRSWDIYGASNDNMLALARLGQYMIRDVNKHRVSKSMELLVLTPLVIYGIDAHIYTRPQSPGYLEKIKEQFKYNPVGETFAFVKE